MASALGNILRLLCIFLVINLVFTQQTSSGTCPTVTGDSSLNLYQYMGLWYKIRTFNWPWSPCCRDRFTSTGIGSITALFTFKNGTLPDQETLYIKYDPAQPATFYAYSDLAKTQLFAIFVLIYADSNGCVVLFSCTQVDEQSHIAILTVICRTRDPMPGDIQPALDAIERQGLGGHQLEPMDQSFPTCGILG